MCVCVCEYFHKVKKKERKERRKTKFHQLPIKNLCISLHIIKCAYIYTSVSTHTYTHTEYIPMYTQAKKKNIYIDERSLRTIHSSYTFTNKN